jgi:hypothetical protein
MRLGLHLGALSGGIRSRSEHWLAPPSQQFDSLAKSEFRELHIILE